MSYLKNIFTIIAVVITLLSAQANTTKKNVAIMEFESKSGVSAGEASMLSDMFQSDLVRTKTFSVLDRNNMKKIMDEQSFQASGCTGVECAVELGRLLNMQYMIVGSLSKFGTKYVVIIDFVNVETGEIVDSAKETSSDMDGMIKISEILAIRFSKIEREGGGQRLTQSTMSDSGSKSKPSKRGSYKVGLITKVDGRDATLNIGKKNGASKNGMYDIMEGTKRVGFGIINISEDNSSILKCKKALPAEAANNDDYKAYFRGKRWKFNFGFLFGFGALGDGYGGGGGMMFNIFTPIGVSVEIGLGAVGYSEDIDGVYSYRDLYAGYLGVNYNFFRYRKVSPYVGFGVVPLYRSRIKEALVYDSDFVNYVGPKAVFNIGVVFFKLKRVNLVLNEKIMGSDDWLYDDSGQTVLLNSDRYYPMASYFTIAVTVNF